jgi:hypothetical protein
MLSFTLLAPLLCLAHIVLSAPIESPRAAATVGKIRGVRDPIYHLYLQANSKNTSIPVLGPEASADEVCHVFRTKSSLLILRTVHYRRNHPIPHNQPIPQHPNRDDILQAAEMGSHGHYDGVGIRRRYHHNSTV